MSTGPSIKNMATDRNAPCGSQIRAMAVPVGFGQATEVVSISGGEALTSLTLHAHA
jgi:hypothetical protein